MPFKSAARRQQRSFIDDIGQFRAGITRRAARDHGEIDPFSQLHFLEWTRRISSRPFTSGRLTVIWRSKRPGRSRAGSRTSGRFVAAMMMTPSWVSNPSISTSKRIEGLFALIVAAADAVAAMTTDRVDFVDENNAGRGFLSLLKHVANAASADADKHLDEIGAADREEWHISLAGNGAGEQGLAGAGRPDQKHAFGMRPPSFWNFFGSRRNSTSSCTSSLASSTPATSLESDLIFVARQHARFDLPKLSAPLPAMRICWRKRK